MKTGISTWSFPSNMALDEQLRLAQTSGFDGFELALDENGPVGLHSSIAELKAIRLKLDMLQLSPAGLATGLYWEANAASADATVRDRAARILERQIEVAAELGIDTILVVPGAVGVDFIPGGEIVPYADAHKRALDFVATALPKAEKRGVTLGIENVWNKFLCSPLEMAAFIDSLGNKHVGAWLDVGNVLATGYPEHWVTALGNRIRRVHFKDYRRAVGSVDGFVDLLSGDVDWPAVMAALRSIGYDGWCTAEMIPPAPFYKHAPDVLIENTGRAIRAILKL